MPVYLVIPLEKKEEIEKALSKLPNENVYKMQENSGWLVSYKGTSKELSYELGIGTEENGTVSSIGSALVSSLTAYYGYGPTEMWEWIRTRSEG